MAHKQIMKHQIISDVFVHWSYLKFFKYNEANFVRSLRSCLQKILRGFRTVKNWERTREARERESEWERVEVREREVSVCVFVCLCECVCVWVGGWVSVLEWVRLGRGDEKKCDLERASASVCVWESARVCESVRECARECERVRESAIECKRVRESVSIWQCQPPAAKSFHLVKEKNCVKIFAKDKWTN